MNCPKCNASNVSTGQGEQKLRNICQSCGFAWDDDSIIDAMAKTLGDIKTRLANIEKRLNSIVKQLGNPDNLSSGIPGRDKLSQKWSLRSEPL